MIPRLEEGANYILALYCLCVQPESLDLPLSSEPYLHTQSIKPEISFSFSDLCELISPNCFLTMDDKWIMEAKCGGCCLCAF